MIYLAGIVSVVVFAVILDRSGLARLASAAVETSRDASRSVRDPALDDAQKERAARAASAVLMRSFLGIALRGALAALLSLACLGVFHVLGLASFSSVVDWLASWPAIVLLSALVAGWYFLRVKR